MPSMPAIESPTEPVAPEQGQEPSDPNSEIISRLDQLKEEFDSIRQQPQQGEPEGDLYDALLNPQEPEAGQQAPEEAGPGQPQAETGFDPNDPAVQALNDYVRTMVNEQVAPIQEERLSEQLQSIEKQFPDILDEKVFPRVDQALDDIVRRSGNEQMRTDPTLVLLAYKAVKAEMADAAAVPAEQAATTGASIETGAGASQTGEPSPADQYVQAVFGGASNKSVFQ